LEANCSIESQDEKREHLHQALLDWRGEHEQLDDVLVIGVTIE
jgi:hypothetical protein